MRLVPLSLGILGALGACGDDRASGPTECEVGPGILRSAVAQLIANQPTCSRDDECVKLFTDVACSGYSSGSCGHYVHRDVADRWDAKQVCDEISEQGVYSDVQCESHSLCADYGSAVCRNGSCEGEDQ